MSHKNQTRRAASDDDSDVEQELQNKKFKNNSGSSNGHSKSKSNTRRDDSDSDSEEHHSKGKASQKADRKTESKNRHDSSEEEEKQGGKKNDGAYEVIIRGLPYSSSDQDLSDFFQDCGEIERVNLLKGPDGRSKGIAFVKFSDEQALQKAIGLTGSDLGGRTVTIEKTIPKEQRNGGDRDRGDRNQQRSERDPTSTTVFIGNLSYQTNEDSIRDLFENCGKIKEVRVATDQDGRPRGFGYVEFGSPDAVDKAIGKTGAKLDGRAIRVDFANSKKNDGGRDGGRDGGNRSGGYGGGRNGGGRSGGYGGDRRNRY